MEVEVWLRAYGVKRSFPYGRPRTQEQSMMFLSFGGTIFHQLIDVNNKISLTQWGQVLDPSHLSTS